VESPSQRYGSAVETPPERRLRHADPTDELVGIQLDDAVYRSLRLLWRERQIVKKALAVGVVVSIILAFVIPKRYQAVTRLMPPDNSSMLNTLIGFGGGGNSAGASAGLGLAASLLGMKTTGALFIAALQSRVLEDRMVDRFDLKKVYGRTFYEDARRDLENATDIGEDRKTGVITIKYVDRDPGRARDITNAYAEELGKLMAEVSTSSARRERIFLEERLKVVKKELDQSAVEFSKFASANTALNIPEQAKAAFTAAARVQGELAAAESQLQGMEQIYTDSNVRVKSLRARIEELRRQVQSSGAADSTTNPSNQSLGQIIRELPRLGVTYADLYRKTMINEAVFEALTKQYELARVQEAKEVPPVNVLDPAVYPERKYSPKRWLVVLIGTMFSFLLSASWILGRDYWERIDPADERKRIVQEIWARSAGRMKFVRNGRVRAATAGSQDGDSSS